MANKRMKARVLLALVRRMARKNGLRVEELQGRGKGSHQHYVVVGADGETAGYFGLTDHPRKLSWTVLQGIEAGLERLFGEKWMEKS
ncbi:hypothetical protein A6A08_01025 [Nocardiopsis sp. TSRI0078]|uniref:hypothetical protein n=1 Tax=unclassified Nocardiopsis TaxID=2649073 RepID=UPI00093DD3AE|nr:hypothetical protein [Nocardiopsis sp. TSRI0078]OKI23415.1 hypothetical protein A6A08_01025 [Nocardiopsis sp. TSRI0078]